MDHTTRLVLAKPGARGTHPPSTELRDALRANADILDGAVPYLEAAVGSRPAAAIAGRVFYATDEMVEYHDTGAAWVPVAARQIAFRAVVGVGDLSFPDTTPQGFELHSTDSNEGGGFNTTSYRFVPPAPGLYRFTCATAPAETITTISTLQLMLYRNGSLHRMMDVQENSRSTIHLLLHGSACAHVSQAEVTAGDYFEMWLSQSGAIRSWTADAHYTFFEGERIARP